MGTMASNERGPLESGFADRRVDQLVQAPHDTHEYSLTGSTRSFETRLIVVRIRPLALSSSNRPRPRTRPRPRSLTGCTQLALDIPQALQREENSRYPSHNGLKDVEDDHSLPDVRERIPAIIHAPRARSSSNHRMQGILRAKAY